MVTTTEQPPPGAPSTSGGSGGTGGQEGHFAVEIEHKVKQLSNEAKEEGVPIVGHPIEGLDNTGESGGGAMDPFTQLFSSGFGWIIDSVSFLREPIDKLDGDAAAVQTAVDSMKTVTENLTYVAHGHREDIPTLADWTGEAAEKHHKSMQLLHEELISLAKVVEGLGTLTAVSGGMVTTLRKIVRDLVATGIGSICIILAAAVAAAVWTLGASIGVGIAASIAAAVAVMIESGRRIDMLLKALGRQAERMGELEGIAEEIANELKRFEKAAGLPSSGGGGPKEKNGKGGSGPEGHEAKGMKKNPGESEPEGGEDDPGEGYTDPEEFKGDLENMAGGFADAFKPPPPDPNETNPDHWNDLRDQADEKIQQIDEEAKEYFFTDQEKFEDLMEKKEEWESVRDDAEARADEASDKLDEQELEQAQQELSQ